MERYVKTYKTKWQNQYTEEIKRSVCDEFLAGDMTLRAIHSRIQKNKIKVSMTETSEPTDNAIAERINGILKDEYLNYHQVKSLKEARIVLEKSIQLYNEQRPHLSIGMLTPNLVQHNKIKPDKLWKTYYRNSVILESVL